MFAYLIVHNIWFDVFCLPILQVMDIQWDIFTINSLNGLFEVDTVTAAIKDDLILLLQNKKRGKMAAFPIIDSTCFISTVSLKLNIVVITRFNWRVVEYAKLCQLVLEDLELIYYNFVGCHLLFTNKTRYGAKKILNWHILLFHTKLKFLLYGNLFRNS